MFSPQANHISGHQSPVDYTPGSDTKAGAVVVSGGYAFVAIAAIAAGVTGSVATTGLHGIVKTTDVFVAGDDVFWNPTANPVGGTAGTGAAAKTGPYYLGFVPPDGAAATDATTVQAKLLQRPAATVAGASTAAAGSTTTDATVLPAATSRIYPTTAADDTKGVRINSADKVTGRTLKIGNGVSNKILKVYPPSGGTINGAAADAAFSSASGKGVETYCLDSSANTWLAW